ncbi:hypothetical protein HCG49_07990 [Arenibacter sp. 6A1]|uniref:transposase n=1 Tax=Arenibacter sp. 6A1 TaxID=2720391 RepID=UPI0014475202|nr:transposase [Arenibacter sp. 6A1]NKI26501.1 hypothetical protein [Arenibacter sp. 6A1]
MSDKFQNKYRIPSARMKNWDYSWNAPYFVTICTKNKEHFFGEVVTTTDLGTSTMELSETGKMAEKYWSEIPQHFPFVALGAYVVMPNHVHGVIIIHKTDDRINGEKNDRGSVVETPKLGVSTNKSLDDAISNNSTTNPYTPMNRTASASQKWKSGTLGVIINQYKRICTINARKIHAGFAWQPRFYDHIIRSNESFLEIETYIHENPEKWSHDKFNNL